MVEISISGGDDEDAPVHRPCQIFDLICGTSTGGLIAILLGRFGLGCGEAIDVYKEVGATMFGGEANSANLWKRIMEGGQISPAIFERTLEDLTQKYTGRKDALFRPLKSAPDTVVHESTKVSRPPFICITSFTGKYNRHSLLSYRKLGLLVLTHIVSAHIHGLYTILTLHRTATNGRYSKARAELVQRHSIYPRSRFQVAMQRLRSKTQGTPGSTILPRLPSTRPKKFSVPTQLSRLLAWEPAYAAWLMGGRTEQEQIRKWRPNTSTILHNKSSRT